MRLKSLNLVTLLLLVFNVSIGQKNGVEISFEEEIRKGIENKSSDFFYPKLLKKIKDEPDKITKEEIKHLYYGQIYKAGTGLSFIDNKSEDVFRKAVAQNNCKKVFSYGYLNLKENPILLTTLIPINNCLLKTKETDSSFLDLRIKMLLEIIFETGDGKTKESAIKIANIEDDYILKTILGFKNGKESLEIFNGKSLSVWDNGKSKLFFEDCWNYKYK